MKSTTTNKSLDLSLYLVTDRSLAGGRTTLEIIEQAVRGGVTAVQLREKQASTREFLREAQQVCSFLREHDVALIINDRLDVAMAIDADAVHLGQQDMPLETARKLVGSSMQIGISVESVDDALSAAAGGADYLGVSPVFDTPTKTDTAPALGLKGLAAIRRAVSLPLVAIGGLHAGTAQEVLRHGADGLAVVSAIVSAPSPQEAARELRNLIDAERAP